MEYRINFNGNLTDKQIQALYEVLEVFNCTNIIIEDEESAPELFI